jgi:DNA-binding NarL/FixJ family response regulator
MSNLEMRTSDYLADQWVTLLGTDFAPHKKDHKSSRKTIIVKVLIIEREKTFRQSLGHFMEHYRDFEVFIAPSRREALSLLQTTSFDMIICGNRLPDGDGLETLKELAKRNAKLISILMTTDNDESLRQRALKAGIEGYLEKPFDLNQLEELMGQFTGKVSHNPR